ncbi:hypothetical protein HPP92_017190 [Vanilla planifolia]|uniref:Dof zinc finger protein n=1 Tax=Vanilla planifolia TaxID=51239 RepID=A0A835QHK1_VANPL|nr:hypothetical protein HPP92_017190 [Vanilla planifolia]
MIQGLLAGVVEERNLSIQSGGLLSDAHAPFLSSTASAVDIASTLPSSASSALPPLQMIATASSPSTASEAPQQNLRCPRCDSSNTKFCYYNNYNLTQPRHFCKTCRRYWTKGGALRNVPIGGGCRKAKPAPAISAAAVKSAAAGGKPTKPVFSMDRPASGSSPYASNRPTAPPTFWPSCELAAAAAAAGEFSNTTTTILFLP